MQSKTAILLFTRDHQLEARAKQFVADASLDTNARIAAELIHHARQTARQTGMHLVVFDSSQQQGNTFGERFSHAFESVFTQGFDHIIAIGNDTPSLLAADLLQASVALKGGKPVLGPSEDKGAYLIGMSRQRFNRTAFAALAWETERILFDLRDYFGGAAADIEFLAEKLDADDPASFEVVLKRLRRDAPYLHLNLISILSDPAPGYAESEAGIPDPIEYDVKRFRGPPIC